MPKETRTISSVDTRLMLEDAVADLLHVLNTEIPDEIDDPLYGQVWVFDQLWAEIKIAVARGQQHFDKETIDPDEFATPIEVVYETLRKVR